MIKKTLLFIMAVLIVSCNSSRSVVQTTKSKGTRSNASKIGTNRKPIVKVNKPDMKATQNNNSNTEVLEATTRVKVTTEMVLAYIEKYKKNAKDNMIKHGVPASITLSQAILESGAGTGPLSIQANNHFGIKCHKDWTGESIKHDDDQAGECFRKYDNPDQSFEDYSFFLVNRKWYAGLFKLNKDDYKAWAKGLKAAGYATDPKYPEKLIGIIERYQLSRYDSEVLGTNYISVSKTNSSEEVSAGFKEYQVTQGDTLYSISKKFKVSVEELKRKNNMSDNAISIGQNLKVE
jgi:flagellum-specific peptidoglycan hydrolase FlgJ